MKRFFPLFLLLSAAILLLTGCTARQEEPVLYEPPAESWQGDAPQDVLDLIIGRGHTVTPVSTEPGILHAQRYYAELDGDRLHAVSVFRYESAKAAQAEAACIDADGYGFRFPLEGDEVSLVQVSWVDTPHFYLDGDRIILYIGRDAGIRFALKEAFGAPFAGADVAAICGTE